MQIQREASGARSICKPLAESPAGSNASPEVPDGRRLLQFSARLCGRTMASRRHPAAGFGDLQRPQPNFTPPSVISARPTVAQVGASASLHDADTKRKGYGKTPCTRGGPRTRSGLLAVDQKARLIPEDPGAVT